GPVAAAGAGRARLAGARAEYEGLPALVLAEVLRGSGEAAASCEAIGAARAQVMERAARIAGAAERARFLDAPISRRTLALAAEWLGGEAEEGHSGSQTS